jgi:hypothetical protein
MESPGHTVKLLSTATCPSCGQSGNRDDADREDHSAAASALRFLRIMIAPVSGTMSCWPFFCSQAVISPHCLSVIAYAPRLPGVAHHRGDVKLTAMAILRHEVWEDYGDDGEALHGRTRRRWFSQTARADRALVPRACSGQLACHFVH